MLLVVTLVLIVVVAGKSGGEVVSAAVEVVLGSASASASEFGDDACWKAAIDVALAAEYRHRHGG